MTDHASRMEFEEAQPIKEKYDLLEEYRSRSTVVSATIHDVEVFSYVDEEETFYVNYMKVKDGAVVQSHSFEMKRRLEETAEELLLLAVTELRQQFGEHAPEIILPMKLDFAFDDVQVTIPQRGDKLKLLELSRRNAMQYKIDLEKQRTLVDPERHQKRVLNSLKEALQMEKTPDVIECFDNSNFQGDLACSRHGAVSERQAQQGGLSSFQHHDKTYPWLHQERGFPSRSSSPAIRVQRRLRVLRPLSLGARAISSWTCLARFIR